MTEPVIVHTENNMKKIILTVISITVISLMSFAAIGTSFNTMPDFGPNGLKGLDDAQKASLSAGESVLTKNLSREGLKNALIVIAYTFDQPIEEVWKFQSNPTNKILYVDEIKDVKEIKRTPTDGIIEFLLKFIFIDVRYRLIYKFDQANYYIHWEIDPSFDNSIQDLRGFYRFYPYGDGKTLARYGTRVTIIKLLPRFIEDYIIKRNMPKAIASFKKFINSGGTYRK